MSTPYRIAVVLLVFLLLISAGAIALASTPAGQDEKRSPQQRGEPGCSPLDGEYAGWREGAAVLSPPWQRPTPEPEGGIERESPPTIEPELLRALLEAESAESRYFRVIVHLRERADLEAAAGGALSATDAHSRVVSALQTTATRSQALLRAYLEGAQSSGRVKSYTPFWIVNAVTVHADRDTVFDLAARPEVAAVHLDHYRRWITSETRNLESRPGQYPASGIEWGVARIRADQVWASLHISGTGVVVAGMDTGVDWLHQALQANYRAYNPHGPTNHTYSWHDATGGGALYPVDGHGHGSHTVGTIVGQDGIGVAPGARWIAVRVLNSQGYGYDSWIHEGFQWLLVPGGDVTTAPDVVNCSWGDDNGSLTTFQPDLQALRAAGIFAVFSSGNDGPGVGTVGSPASLPEAFAVGATDSDDEVPSSSSRGPSPWGEVRPHVAAPGVNVRSSLPGGAYGTMNGTSMAAPHVSGIAALLRSVSPTLSITHTAFLITSTAVPLGAFLPNNDSGWGRVDAFAAAVALARPGFITGTVTRSGDGVSIVGAMVAAIPHGGGGGGTATADDDGNYLLALAPTVYDVTGSAFAYKPATKWGVVVTTNTTSVEHFSLEPLPAGTLRGQVTNATTGMPVTATITALDTPLEVTASAYEFALPVGTYTVRARSLGYRIVTATVDVITGQVTAADFALTPAPTILLMDSGAWYYGSQANYFRQALDDLTYTYDEWSIKHLPDEVPTAADLTPYEVVVWSAPEDSPGYIGAQGAITGYLSSGGWLLLTGQDVGFWDGGGTAGFWSAYYRDYLKARLVRDNARAWVLEGLGGDVFAGLTITITGAGGANNQDFPDEIGVVDLDAATPVLTYQEDGCGGIRVGTCLDYRVIYLSFGFEAIDDRAARREVMGRALDWLTSPLPTVGVELKPTSQLRVELPGSIVTHTLRVRHVGQAGATDTVSLSLDGASWVTQLSAQSLYLAPCTSATVVVSVTVPSTARWDARNVITLTARSSLSATLAQTAILTSKAPAPILLVDDDRWYAQEAKYEAALTGGDFLYDYWHTGSTHDKPPEGSPPLGVLQRYPIIVWFTGYDWYAPVTAEEEETLASYLDGSGRLFLSSQDFLYYHHDDPFSRDYLGVLTYTEDITPTLAQGVPENPIGERLGPYPLDYPFRNWSDAVVPTPGTAVPFRDQERRPIALAQQEGDYRTVFFSFPYETLPEEARPVVMERIVGWLSWLGSSTFAADRGAISGSDTLTYTITLRNDGPASVTGSVSNTLPVSLTLIPGSLTGPATYDPTTQRFSWQGPLGPGAAITCTYRVTVAAGLPAGTLIANVACLGLEDQGVRFHRAAVVRVDAPDLSPSTFRCDPSSARPGSVVTCTLAVANAGSGDAFTATVTNLLPGDATLIPGSLAWVGGGAAEALIGTVRWTGPLSTGSWVTLTYRLILPNDPVHPPLYSAAFLEDGVGEAWERATWVILDPWRSYLPVINKNYYAPQ